MVSYLLETLSPLLLLCHTPRPSLDDQPLGLGRLSGRALGTRLLLLAARLVLLALLGLELALALCGLTLCLLNLKD